MKNSSNRLRATWGEYTPQRKGYRNGTYTRDFATSSGPIKDVEVPRDREGCFHTQVFDRYQRYEPQVAEGLTQMFVAGVSTKKVGEVAQTLMGVAPSASSVSRLNQTLTQQFETWRERPLQTHWRILYLDGVHFTIRHGDQTDSTIILTALGVDLEGNKEVLALRACAEEDKDGWMERLARHTDTQGHPSRFDKEEALIQLAAFKTKYQKRYPEAIRSLMEDEEHLLTFYAFPPVMHRYIRTTNATPKLF